MDSLSAVRCYSCGRVIGELNQDTTNFKLCCKIRITSKIVIAKPLDPKAIDKISPDIYSKYTRKFQKKESVKIRKPSTLLDKSTKVKHISSIAEPSPSKFISRQKSALLFLPSIKPVLTGSKLKEESNENKSFEELVNQEILKINTIPVPRPTAFDVYELHDNENELGQRSSTYAAR